MKRYFETLGDLIGFIEGAQAPILTEHEGRTYANKQMLLVKSPECANLEVGSLSALVTYITENVDDLNGPFVITIDNVRRVTVRSSMDLITKQREEIIVATSGDYASEFGRYQSLDKFIIQLRSRFVPTPHSLAILSALGTMKKDEGVQVDDDGFSQQITAKKGVSYGQEALPNPAVLKPFRTFSEIEQPESEFVLRVNSGLEPLLEEADGGTWKITAMQSIADFLTAELEDEILEGKVIVLA